MLEVPKVVLLVACLLGVLCCARYFPGIARGLGVFLPVLGGALLTVLATTATSEKLSEVHRWTAHYYVIFLWLAVPMASVILLHRKVLDRPVIAFLQSGLVWSLIPIALLAGFTGYLPSQNPELSSETYWRFLLLHGLILPGILVCLQALWLWFSWPERQFRGVTD